MTFWGVLWFVVKIVIALFLAFWALVILFMIYLAFMEVLSWLGIGPTARLKKSIKDTISRGCDFHPTKSIRSMTSFNLMVDTSLREFYYVIFDSKGQATTECRFSHSDIKSLSISEAEKTTVVVSKRTKKSDNTLERAVIGGALLGGAGALFGAATATKKRKDTYIAKEQRGKVTIRLGLDHPATQLLDLVFDPTAGDEWSVIFETACALN